MQDVMFQRWLSTNESQMHVVGGMELSTNTVALLTQALEGLPGAVWITFFCGIHATPGGGLEGAQGIMRRSIFQILRIKFNCAFIEEGLLKQIFDYEISQLCGLFQNLLF